MIIRFISLLILITIHNVCYAEVRTYFEPEVGKVIIMSGFSEDKKADEFPPDIVIFYKIKDTSECFIRMTHYTLTTHVVPMPIGKYRMIIDDTPFNLTFLGHDYSEATKAGEGFIGSRIKFAVPEELQNKILKAKHVKLILSTDEQPFLETPPLMLKEWKEVIKNKN